MPVSLRAARPDDALCLGALATQVFYDTYATRGISAALVHEAQTHFSEAAMAARLAMAGVSLTVADVDGHLAGFIDLQAGSACPVPTVTGPEVLRLYVQAPFQRQGLGRALLRHAQAQAQAGGARALWLTAWVGNAPALAFYARLGWQVVGRTLYRISGQAHDNAVLAMTLGASDT